MKLDNCRWQDALDWQIRLWRWSQTDVAARYFTGFPLADKLGRPGIAASSEFGGHVMASMVEKTMETADPWWVSPDVAALVAEAAEDMPHDPLVQEDVIAPAGFALIGGPPLLYPALDHGEMTGKRLAMRALSWWTMMVGFGTEGKEEEIPTPEPVLVLTHYAHIEDDDDFVDKLRRDIAAGGGFGAPLSAQPGWIQLSPTGMTMVPFGDTSMYTPNNIDYSGNTRWTMAFFRFVQQQVVGEHRDMWGRAQRREVARVGLPRNPDDGYVTTIRLRKVSRPREEGYEPIPSGRHLTERHIRSGHWRRQWYPSLGLHRPIYIHQTVVGPDDAPLRLRKARGVIVNR